MKKLKRLDEAPVGSIVKYKEHDFYLMVCDPLGVATDWNPERICLMWIKDHPLPVMLGRLTWHEASDPDWWLVDPKEMP